MGLTRIVVALGFVLSAMAWANIFGDDDRTLITEKKRWYEPWRCVGKLVGGGSASTGTLVGKDLVLTCAHCVYELPGKTPLSDDMKFQLGLIEGKPTATARVVEIYSLENPTREKRESDWAIVRLDRPIGETYGWMEIDTEYLMQEGKPIINVAGYSRDLDDGKTLWYQKECHKEKSLWRDRADHLFVNDCDIVPGASGGPAFVHHFPDPSDRSRWTFRLVGINVAGRAKASEEEPAWARLPHFDPKTPNFSISARAFAEKLEELRNKSRPTSP